MTRFLMAHQHN